MRSFEDRIDVTEAAGLAEAAKLAVSLHLPEKIDVDEPLELLVCLHGGGYRRSYWHSQFPSYPGYSFAEHAAARGKAVLAIDLLGMGDSSRPEPETKLNRARIAAATHQALDIILRDLRNGRFARAGQITVTGVGHSIGGMMVITQQAAHESFDRLAVLGWANEPMVLGGVDPAALASTVEPGYLLTPRPIMRALFYGSDVPPGLIEADEAMASPTPSCLGRDALLPGVVHAASAMIRCPVFVMHGSIDTSSNLHGEARYFTNSRDVTLMRLDDTAHCHNFARRRHELWNRIDRWIGSLPIGKS